MEEANLPQFAEKRFGELISQGFNLFGKLYTTLIIPLAVFAIISITLNTFLLTELRWMSYIVNSSINFNLEDILSGNFDPATYTRMLQSLYIVYGILVLDYIIGAVVTAVAMSSVTTFVFKTLVNGEADFTEEFKRSFNKRMIIPVLLLGLFVPLGFALLWIPGIILFGFFLFTIFTFNDPSIERPANESRMISKGSFIKIIGIFIISVLIIFLVSLVFNALMVFIWSVDNATYMSWHNPMSRNFGAIFIYNLVYMIPELILAPLFICLLTPFYAHCKAKRALGSQYQRAYPQPSASYEPSWKSSLSTEVPQGSTGIYCPFCGEIISTPKKFCPNCGKNIAELF